MTHEYDKLVRDEIPALVEASGETPITHAADDAEYERRLVAKLDEEVEEFREDQRVEELADVLEVVYALGEVQGTSPEELEELRAEKAAARGRFEERIVLDAVEP